MEFRTSCKACKVGSMNRDDASFRRNSREDGAIPADLVGVDRFLSQSLRSVSNAPEGLASRVTAVSLNQLRGPVLRRLEPQASVATSSRTRWARMAFASAAAIAVVCGSWIATHSKAPIRDGQFVRSSPHGDGSEASPAEATLVALLEGPSSGFASRGGWINAETLGGGDAARVAAPVLETRGTQIDDFETEMGAILGIGDPASL